jgi:hypothetical protein
MERLVRFAGMKLIIAVVTVVCSMGLAAQVDAISFTVGDQYYLGVISPDGGSPTTEAAQINTLVALAPGGSSSDGTNSYTRSGNTLCYNSCPTATAVGSVGEETGLNGGDNAGSLDGGWTYLKAKYDAAKAGAYVWYVAGLSGDFTVPTTAGTCGDSGCGLSHWQLFNPGTSVAEQSTTFLMGLAFAGVAFFGRKFLPRA